jgi:hypothetical protein
MRMSTDIGGTDSSSKATPVSLLNPLDNHNLLANFAINLKILSQYLWFPCGVIRGALANLGVSSVVMAETSNLPQCKLILDYACASMSWPLMRLSFRYLSNQNRQIINIRYECIIV